MKLYNLYESLILEEIEKSRQILTEAVSVDDVQKAIEGKYNIKIKYKDEGQEVATDRYIQVYNLSKTTGGNLAIRAYQIGGASTSNTGKGFWKIFRLDRIENWLPTNVRWKQPVSNFDSNIPKYNADGDRSMASVMSKVNVDGAPAINKPINNPVTRPQAQPIQKPVVKPTPLSQPVKTPQPQKPVATPAPVQKPIQTKKPVAPVSNTVNPEDKEKTLEKI